MPSTAGPRRPGRVDALYRRRRQVRARVHRGCDPLRPERGPRPSHALPRAHLAGGRPEGLRARLRGDAAAWRAQDPGTEEAFGVGAFNLLKREAYLRAGTHGAIRLRPDDDMRLARLLKESGYSQGVAYETGSVSVEWHETLAGAVRGLEKSIFPGVDYRLSLILLASLMLFSTNILPFFGVSAPPGGEVALRRRRAGGRRHVRLRAEGLRLNSLTTLRCASSLWDQDLYLRRAQVRLGNGGEGRHRVAGHLLPLAP